MNTIGIQVSWLCGTLCRLQYFATEPTLREEEIMAEAPAMFRGLRTIIYGVPDLPRARDWYTRAFGTQPYFEEHYYVGFQIGGFELGLDPHSPSGAGGTTAYWGVANIEDAVSFLQSLGASLASPIQDVGEGIKVATVNDPFGNRLGVIENPHFDPNATR
jgi:predicted enzyme related to lactoylglutathione lyase